MKKFTLLFALLAMLTLVSCKKEENVLNPKTFTFVSLTATKSEIAINEVTDITATATGENLTYGWSCSEGAIFDDGPDVKFSICHSTRVRVTCTVSDASGNSESKDIYIQINPQ
ncbi:MAG: hypothetical protein A2X61_09345 [Ignavibacteria bacterium GWB2_35_12]|nr:MAG: hypothetical protein A2X61_09345 [Ignavibacteria bacterium GWB2_35_12]OGV10226.1 MAG: hypothetical protein A2330_09300 [Ignavibacteria bacterium RIFOXYB2_FULL_36_7]OGV22012.1 MAG: hypothetical protein A2475_04470 [Ignavibacteria bacterium RIFOXYC2_FULL_35_21]